jgi:mannose/fructose/N-acetylgalactosamine-specific phosphotransferase system component IIB
MKNIVLARIDDRLIHGQVMSKWAQKVGFNRIVVVDNDLVRDVFTCKFMKSIAPKKMTVDIVTEADGIELLKGEPADNEKVVILAKAPQVFEALIEGGVDIKKLMVGGMGSREGRKPLIRNLAASLEERESLKRIAEKGVDVFYQDIPETKPTDLRNLL